MPPDADPPDVPEVVTVHLWGVRTAAVPRAVLRMGVDRVHLARTPARFWKLLGTGDGGTFRLRDADPHHWGVLASWHERSAAEEFDRSRTVRGWDAIAHERLAVTLRPVASRGRWAGRRPFGDPVPRRVTGPVASITRARIRRRAAARFWAAVPPVAADLRGVEGLRLAVGIGESPLGLQGTFSVWDSAEALTGFAHRRAAHAEVVRRTAAEGWYAEELFARFEVLGLRGRLHGRVY